MPHGPPYQLLADFVLVLHFAVVAFVIAGPVLIVVGNRGAPASRWRWVNSRLFRSSHGSAIAFVIAQAWLGVACPLTMLESWLRTQGFAPTYDSSFIEHWVHRALYYEAAPWVFLTAYSLFGAVVAVVWWRFPAADARRVRTARPHTG